MNRLGLILLMIYALAVCFDVFPPKLLQPDWFLNFAYILGSYISIPLVGLAMVHLSGQLSPNTNLKFQVRMARLAAALAFVFLLLQPLLGAAVYRSLRNLGDYNNQQAQIINSKAAQLIQVIRQAQGFPELQLAMTRLQGPPIPAQAQAIPLPELKQQLLEVVKTSQAAFPDRLKASNAAALEDLYRKAARSSVLCGLGALGFAFLAKNPVTHKNILISFFGSLGLFGLTPASLYKSFTSYRKSFKKNQAAKASLRETQRSAQRLQSNRRKEEAKRRDMEKRAQIAKRKFEEQQRKEQLRAQRQASSRDQSQSKDP